MCLITVGVKETRKTRVTEDVGERVAVLDRDNQRRFHFTVPVVDRIVPHSYFSHFGGGDMVAIRHCVSFCHTTKWTNYIWLPLGPLQIPATFLQSILNFPFSSVQFSSVQPLSRVRLLVTPWITARQASLSITNSRSLPKPMSIESVMPSNRLILCFPLFLLPPMPSSIRVFSNESTLRMRWPKYWSFSFSISPSSEQPGLTSFRMDWLDLLAVQGTLKGLLQHHTSKAWILQHSAFFTVQLSHPYMTTGKTIVLIRWTFVGKVMSLLFNMLSRLVITFLPRSKHLLISWLQSPSAVILEPRKIKVWHCFHCFPIYLPWSDGTRCHDLSFLNVEL